MARARAAPRPPTARAITAAPHTGGLRGAKNGKSRSEWPPFGPKNARSQKGFSASGSSSLGFHGQPQGGESRADTKRAPVALISGEQAPHPRRRAASQSQGPASAPAARAGLGRNVEALQMERRGASPAARKECRGAARRARMEREPLAGAEPLSPPGRRPGAARATATRSRRGRGAEPDTHPAPGSSTPSVPPRRLRAPHLLLPPGKGGGLVGEEEEGAGGASPLPAPLRPLQAQRSPPFPSGLGAAPPPARPAVVRGPPRPPAGCDGGGPRGAWPNPGSRRRGVRKLSGKWGTRQPFATGEESSAARRRSASPLRLLLGR
ncbi:formin-like protein 20 [Nannospalax galili]|uniref:formin-like protein 20 n=1 Tax=Nannospalax galili TaxID=1026970 RepID=UPI00111BF640|nr:formin-like protein 20 [Nannospalax galili]